MKLLTLTFLGICAVGAYAGEFRTDINPALRYYQAYLSAPKLPPADEEYLFNSGWRSRPLEKRVGELLARYDNEFEFVRQAAQATVPCDWGVDLTQGPYASLPGLAPAKGVAQTTRLRAYPRSAQYSEPGQKQFPIITNFPANGEKLCLSFADGSLSKLARQIQIHHSNIRDWMVQNAVALAFFAAPTFGGIWHSGARLGH